MYCLREPGIAADAKGHGTYAKAPWVALLMLSRLLNSAFAVQNGGFILKSKLVMVHFPGLHGQMLRTNSAGLILRRLWFFLEFAGI